MSEKIFQLDIVTPMKIIYSAKVSSFSAPGVEGGFQVLKSHAPLLAGLTIGEIKLTDTAGKEHSYATSGGFAEVHEDKVILLAETAEDAEHIDFERASASLQRAQERLSSKQQGLDHERAHVALARAKNRLKIARKVAATPTH